MLLTNNPNVGNQEENIFSARKYTGPRDEWSGDEWSGDEWSGDEWSGANLSGGT